MWIYAFVCLHIQVKSSPVLYLKMIITIFRLYPKINYISFFDSSLGIWYIVFKILLGGFICLCTGVVLYNVYKSKWNPPKYEHIVQLKNSLTWYNLLKLLTLSNITWCLIKRVYKWLFILLLEIYYLDTNILYQFMGFLALMASFEYLKSIFEQLIKSDKKDFSLTSSYMRKKITLNWFIKCVCIFCIGKIFLKYNILKILYFFNLWFK